MKCERCKIEKEQVKARKPKREAKSINVKFAEKVYTPNPKERNYSEKVKKQAIKMSKTK